ncbi:hypothetical protein H5T58_01330, partial [Candidatus Parcubacteria bacterium]|nr:hypothetical protein [Candidatus Parcubacteria bacterium]
KKIENSNWEKELIEPIKKELENQKIYITNLVKCPTPNANYPPKEAIRACIQFLEKEIEFLQPIKIFAFGAFTFEVLTRKKIKLNQFFSTFNQDSVNERILPCYFPTGRGNFQLAIEGLKRLLKYLKWTKLQQPN